MKKIQKVKETTWKNAKVRKKMGNDIKRNINNNNEKNSGSERNNMEKRESKKERKMM